MSQPQGYLIDAQLLQLVANLLSEMPAARSRHALNALEASVRQQDEKHQQHQVELAVQKTIDNWRAGGGDANARPSVSSA